MDIKKSPTESVGLFYFLVLLIIFSYCFFLPFSQTSEAERIRRNTKQQQQSEELFYGMTGTFQYLSEKMFFQLQDQTCSLYKPLL
jgi:hypothetical protein